MTLLNRRAALIVDDIRIDGLRTVFAIERGDGRSTGKATIQVFNLSQQTRTRFDAGGVPVVLEAGYVGDVGVVFAGTAYKVGHRRVEADMVTTIEAADGGKEVSAAKGSWSYGPRSSVTTIIRDICSRFTLPLSTGSRITPSPPVFAGGWAFVGPASAALSAVCAASGLTWSVQDRQIQILDAVPGDGTQAIVLSSSSGMIGSPERVEVKDEATKAVRQRVAVRCLIQPRIRPARIVDVDSVDVPGLSGRYTVKAMKTSGDTHGDDWTSTLELDRI